jgi:hypothetical protein
MRRDKKVYYSFKQFFPILFWRECVVCHKEFIRERMWRAAFDPYAVEDSVFAIGVLKMIVCEKCFAKKDTCLYGIGRRGTRYV